MGCGRVIAVVSKLLPSPLSLTQRVYAVVEVVKGPTSSYYYHSLAKPWVCSTLERTTTGRMPRVEKKRAMAHGGRSFCS
jgi:hypothetical protein